MIASATVLALGTAASAGPPQPPTTPAPTNSTDGGFFISFDECDHGSLVGKTVAELRAAGLEISGDIPDGLVPVPAGSPVAIGQCDEDPTSPVGGHFEWSADEPDIPELDAATRKSLLAARSARRKQLLAAQRAAEKAGPPTRLRSRDVPPIELWSDEGGQFIVDDSGTAWGDLDDPYDTVMAALEREQSAAGGDGFFWLTPSAQFAKVAMRFELWTGRPPAANGDVYQAKVWFYGRHLDFQNEGPTLGRYLTLERPGRYWVRLTRQGGATSWRTGRESWLLQFWPAP